MVVIDYFSRFGRKIAELLNITHMFQNKEMYGPFGMSIFLLIFFVFFGWIIIKKVRKTRNLLSNFARERGFSFSTKDKQLMTADFFSFPLFKRGRSRGIRNVFKGRFKGAKFTLFDYWYKISDMSSNYLVAVFPTHYSLPNFELRPESIGDKIRQKYGQNDIDFQTDREFSRRYLLLGTDETAVRELFHEGCRIFFNSIDKNEIGGVEGGGHWLVFSQWNADYMSRTSEKYVMDIGKCLDNAFNVYTFFKKLHQTSHK